jgi:DNA-binding CsgD family transcriptional regulator
MIDLFSQLMSASEPDPMYGLAIKLFQNLPFHIYYKDLDGKYLACNDTQAITLGFRSGVDLLGLTDFDMCAESCARILRMTDQSIIMQEKPRMLIENVMTLNNETFKTFSCKLPLRTSTNKISGIFGLSFIINIDELQAGLFKPDACNTSASRTYQNLQTGIEQLTQRQEECLFCLVKGMTIKQIANELALSPRTVEHHIESIKNKLRCNSRSELIAKALKQAFIMEKLTGS